MANRFTEQPKYDNNHPRIGKLKHVLTGKKFGRLYVLGLYPEATKQVKWVCRCDCGKYTISFGFTLISGDSSSCGCVSAEKMQARWRNDDPELRKKLSENASNVSHRLSKHPLYRVWTDMKRRCFNPKNVFYDQYGGRGITVCKEWMSFEVFYSDMHSGYEKGKQIGRIDNDGDYCKANCRWETSTQQQRNKKNTIYVNTPDGEMQITYAAERYGLSPGCILHRLKAGWEHSKIFTTPSSRAKK